MKEKLPNRINALCANVIARNEAIQNQLRIENWEKNSKLETRNPKPETQNSEQSAVRQRQSPVSGFIS